MATLVLKILHSKKHETLKKKTKEIIELKFQYTIRIQKADSDIKVECFCTDEVTSKVNDRKLYIFFLIEVNFPCFMCFM